MTRKKLTVYDYLRCKGKRQLSVLFVYSAEEARVYKNFKKEYDRLQNERIEAFKSFHDDTINKKFDDPKITVDIEDKEFENFLKLAEKY